jgi:L-fuculose-phosphate aldolase
MPDRALTVDLAAHCSRMNASGLNRGSPGNLSVRTKGGMLVTPSGVPFDHLEPADVVPMDLDGRYEHRLEPSTEWRFHRDIYVAKPEVQAIVHAHPIYCTTLAIRGLDIPAVHYVIAAAGGNTIRCAPYATFGTPEFSAVAVTALEGRSACLLANHGMVTVGTTLTKALWLAEAVEAVAQLYFNSLLLGGGNIIAEDEMGRVAERLKSYTLKPKD